MSEFWVRKIRSYHAFIDYDKNGVITTDDFTGMADNLSDSSGITDPGERESIRKKFLALYDKYAIVLGCKDGTPITESVLIESLRVQRNDPDLKRILADVILEIFKTLDLNGDNFIDEDEFEKYFMNLGFPDVSFAKSTFNGLDINHDGVLSFEELLAAVYDYLFSDDEASPAKFFCGPLID